MATTVEQTALTVTITEDISLNGVTYGNTVSTTFATQGQVDQRIMSIALGAEGAFTDIFSFSTVDGQGIGVKNDYAYFRITNLDDTNFVTLQVTAGDTFWIKLKAAESFMLMDNEMDAIASSTAFAAFADITKVSADANTAACDIEYVVVTA